MEEQLVIEEFAASPEGEPFLLELGSWEGPLDLLLALARSQKVDLREISILALVEQYLDFIANAKALKLEIAADYLVMAAWLAYLKSCLLLPREPHVDPSPEELALRLQLRLERLNAMREAGARLMGRDRLGRDVFARGLPDGLRIIRKAKWDAQIFDLIQAYGQVKARAMPAFHIVARRHVMTLEDAMREPERRILLRALAAHQWNRQKTAEVLGIKRDQCEGIIGRETVLQRDDSAEGMRRLAERYLKRAV